MYNSTPITIPSGYAPAYAAGFADPADNLVLVSADKPLPVALTSAEVAAPPALEGEASDSGLFGPFAAVAGRMIGVALDGNFVGTVTLLRSIDGGVTRQPLRAGGRPWAVFDGPGFEQVWFETEDGATFWLDIVLGDGPVAFRVSQ